MCRQECLPVAAGAAGFGRWVVAGAIGGAVVPEHFDLADIDALVEAVIRGNEVCLEFLRGRVV